MRWIALIGVFAACTPVPEHPDLTPLSQGTGFITDGCIPMTRAPEPPVRAVYLDAVEDWLAEPDVPGRFDAADWQELRLADCGTAWLVWNADPVLRAAPDGVVWVQVSKGLNQFLKLEVR